jgi:hypothetical protein
MTEPDDALAREIAGRLDEGLEQIGPHVRDRLRSARAAALARYREVREPEAAMAWAGPAGRRVRRHGLHGARTLIPVATLVIALAVFAYWQTSRPAGTPANGLADIDVRLLTDELPINAFLDKGFDTWLKRASR